MTVQAIRLINFMAFEDSGWIELRPITLLFGRNSSGKSVFTRALHLMKQSTGADAKPFRFYDEEGIDLESFTNVIHGNRVMDGDGNPVPMEIAFRCEIKSQASLIFTTLKKHHKKRWGHYQTEKDSYPVEFILSYTAAPNTDVPQLNYFSISVVSRPGGLLFQASRTSDEERNITGDVWLFQTDLLHGHERGRKASFWTKVSIESERGFLPELSVPWDLFDLSEFSQESLADYRLVKGILTELETGIIEFLNNINCIPAARPEPQRSYAFRTQDGEKWKRQGLGSFYRYLKGEVNTDDFERVDALVRHLEIGQGVDFSHEEYGGVHATVLRIKDSVDTSRSLVDMGYGVSQVFPVLTEIVLLEDGAMVIIDQPELSLHPRAQTNLADGLIEGVQKSTGRLLIETHSQYIVLRMLRRMHDTFHDRLHQSLSDIRLKPVTPEVVGIYAIDRPDDSNTSSIWRISVNREGEFIDHWPNGFFTESFDELFPAGE